MEIKHGKQQIENKLKDRGDVNSKKNYNEKQRRKIDCNKEINFELERGDSERPKAIEKNGQEKRRDETRIKHISIKKEIDKPKCEKFKFYPILDEIRNYELEKRRLLREKYTFRYASTDGSPNYSEKGVNGSTHNTEQSDCSQFVERVTKKQGNGYQTGITNDSSSNEVTKAAIDSEKKESVQRKPIIKTISSSNDKAKIYKAVTFIDQKQNPPKPLQINLTSNVKKTIKIPKLMDFELSDAKTDNCAEKEPAIKKKKIKRLKRNTSPELCKGDASPPATEVARWAPASVNPHTLPYYDAWVSTTLAAISKHAAKDDPILHKKNLVRPFQRVIDERPKTPELPFFEAADEKYAGRIKVHQRIAGNVAGNSNKMGHV